MQCDQVSISVQNIIKKYRLFGHPGDRIKQALTLGRIKFHQEFTSLQDISLDVKNGETVGIIGQNGSGKSTLLQLICGILKPTSGNIQVKGNIAALLELGAGFNPEFTGKENVFFQGAVMGYSRAEIESKYSDIVKFADIGEYIDQPVRTYSSGMFVRLAFSAMVHTDADILVIDEALAVGDESFQRKCFDKLADYLADNNKIMLFVSHNIRQVERICSKVLWLEKGKIRQIGDPAEVCSAYEKEIQKNHSNIQDAGIPAPNIVYTGEIDVKDLRITNDSNEQSVNEIVIHSPIKIVTEFECHTNMDKAEIEVGIHNSDSIFVVTFNTAQIPEPFKFSIGLQKIECLVPDLALSPGEYLIRLAFFDGYRRRIWVGQGLCPFRVTPTSCTNSVSFKEGIVDLPSTWSFSGMQK